MPDAFFEISGFDYDWFKLFHLSIFWRASVSTLPQFNDVSLGPYEEKIRKMLMANSAGLEDHYIIYGRVITGDKREVLFSMVGKPNKARYEHSHVYYSVYAGVEWNFFPTDHPSSEVMKLAPASVKTAGTILLPVIHISQSNNVLGVLEEQSKL